MICTSTLFTKPVYSCPELLVIGTVDELNATVDIKLSYVSNGRETIIQGSTNGEGLLIVDLSSVELPVGKYVLTTEYDITIGSETGNSILFELKQSFDAGGAEHTEATQTLEILQ